MKKLKTNKSSGITLIALVVTIIVLLILAGISIQMLTGDNGILTRAGQAKENTDKAQLEEQVKLAALAAITDGRGNITDTSLKNELKKNINGLSDSNITGNDKNGWTVKIENKGYYISTTGDVNEASWVENSDGTIDRLDGVVKGIKIGDKINETSTRTVDGKEFDGQWRVLGVENGQLLLVSANFVDSSENSSYPPILTLRGSNGIDNEISKLNTLCAKFADGVKTEKGRSIKVEDINKITGYDPNESRLNPNDLTEKGVFGKNQIYQYGNNVTYTKKAGVRNNGKNVVWYRGDKVVTTETESNYEKFWKLGESSDITAPFTIQSTNYAYFPETLGMFPGTVVASGQTMEGISTTSPAYDMLFKTQSDRSYWLASPCVKTEDGRVLWGVFLVGIPPRMVTNSFGLFESDHGSGGSNGMRCAPNSLSKS